MGMFSEIAAGATAEKLERILQKAIEEGGEVKKFAKEHLYDWYLCECGDSWGIHKENPDIKKEYEE